MPKQTKNRAVKGARFVGYRVVKGASLPSATTITRRYHAAHDLDDSSSNEETDEESFWLQSKRTFAKQPPPPPQGEEGSTTTIIRPSPDAIVSVSVSSPFPPPITSSSDNSSFGTTPNTDTTSSSDGNNLLAGTNSVTPRRTGTPTRSSSSNRRIKIETTIQDADHVDDDRHNNNNTTASKNSAATVERKNGKDDVSGTVAFSTPNKCRSTNEAEEEDATANYCNHNRNATEIVTEAKETIIETTATISRNENSVSTLTQKVYDDNNDDEVEEESVPSAPFTARPSIIPPSALVLQPLPPSESKSSGWWTEAEHDLLLRGIAVYGNTNYLPLAALLPARTERSVEAYIERYNIHVRQDGVVVSSSYSQRSWLKIWKYLNLRLGWTLDDASQNDCLKHGSGSIWLRNRFTKRQPGTLGVDHFFTEDDVMDYCTKNGIHIPALNSSTVLMESKNTKNDDDGLRQKSDDCSPLASLSNTRNSNNNLALNSNKRRKDKNSNRIVLNERSRKKMRKVSQGTHRTKASTPCTTQTKPTVSAMLMCHDENLKWKVGRDETPPWVVKQPRIDHVICLKGSAVTYSGGYYYLPGEDRKRFTSRFSNLGELAKHFARTNAYLLSSSGSLESENNHERSLTRFVQYAMVPGKQSMWENIRRINRSETAFLLHKLGYRRTDNNRGWETPNSFVQAKILNPKYDSLELLCDALRGIDDIYVPQTAGTPKRCKLPVTQMQIMALRLRIAEGFTEFDKDYSDGDYANEDDSIKDLDWADIRNCIATQIDDEMNSGKIVATTKRAMNFDTKYPKGVSNSRSRKNPYAACINWRGKNRHIGCWDTLECAARAYMLAKAILRPSEQEEEKNAKGTRWSILWKYLTFTLGWTYDYASMKDTKDFGASTIWLRKGFTKKKRGKFGQDHFFTENDVITYCEKKTIYPPGSRTDQQDEGEVDNGDDNNYHKASVIRKKNKTKKKKSTSTRNHINRYSIGTRIRKKFSGRWYTGEVINYNKKRQFYLVEFDDGDTEEFDAADMEKWSSKQQQHTIVTKAATSLSFANRICRVEEAMLGATTINDNITNGCGGGYIHRIHNLELQIFAPDYQVPADLVRRLEALEQFL